MRISDLVNDEDPGILEPTRPDFSLSRSGAKQYYFSVNENTKVENFAVNYTIPDFYKSVDNLKFSKLFDDENVTHFERMESFGLSPENVIYNSEIFGVPIEDLVRSDTFESELKGFEARTSSNQPSPITLKKHLNFDASCLRIDIDSQHIRQTKKGHENGIKMELTLPKIYENDFSYLKSESFPRRLIRLGLWVAFWHLGLFLNW